MVNEMYRPLVHFSVQENWLNDPNGLIFYKGYYHMFYQYHPYSIEWGPMHWGHARSKDLIQWENLPVALTPDKNGFCFSGSAIIDKKNTSGFFPKSEGLVAIYTSAKLEGYNGNDEQTQSIAYSVDSGLNWIKYEGNPIIRSDIKDFRDPKVLWYEEEKKWVMVVAVYDVIEFYSSYDLKKWEKTGEFGKDLDLDKGVWECPDLLRYEIAGEIIWVLKISIQGGAPAGGSGEVIIIGKYDGKKFTCEENYEWIDYGEDIYASQTYYNTEDRIILIGWMANIKYPNIPTSEKWRGVMTIPRDLELKKQDGKFRLFQNPVKELEKYRSDKKLLHKVRINKEVNFDLYNSTQEVIINLENSSNCKISVKVFNDFDEHILLNVDVEKSYFEFDRSQSGNTSFYKEFGRIRGGNFKFKAINNFRILIDSCSMEIFINNGEKVITSLLFPREIYNKLSVKSSPGENFLEVENYLLEIKKEVI